MEQIFVLNWAKTASTAASHRPLQSDMTRLIFSSNWNPPNRNINPLRVNVSKYSKFTACRNSTEVSILIRERAEVGSRRDDAGAGRTDSSSFI